MSVNLEDVMIPLSLLDAALLSHNLPILYFFPPPPSSTFDLNKLHSSFMSLVEHDYPILIGEYHVDPKTGIVNVKQTSECREKGAFGIKFETKSTRFKSSEQAIRERSWELMPSSREKNELISVKGTLLQDGGLAIGINTSHALFDGEAFFTFMTIWGQYYSGVKKEERQVVNHARYLLNEVGGPSKMKHPEIRVLLDHDLTTEAQLAAQALPHTTNEFFHFTPIMMKKIKDLASHGGLDSQKSVKASYVSSVDAITALMTVLISRARKHGQDVRISTFVNARRRLEPPLPPNYVGNAMFNAFLTVKSKELQPQPEYEGLVSGATLNLIARRVRESIIRCDDAYMRDALNFLAEQSNIAAVQIGTNYCFGPDLLFTSWLRLDMYGAKFDSVHPSHVFYPQLPGADGVVIFTEAQNGGEGIDVGVLLACSAMENLKKMFTEISHFYS
ncbi:putative transferase [Plasmopara halstedii]